MSHVNQIKCDAVSELYKSPAESRAAQSWVLQSQSTRHSISTSGRKPWRHLLPT